MLRTIIEFSIKQPWIVLALALLLAIAGVRSVSLTGMDVFPEFSPPLIEIQTEAPGLSTEEVESLVTVPLENALQGTPNLKTIRSKSVLGLSSVVMILREGSDLMTARQMVQERLLLAAARLPAIARPPVMLTPLSSTSRVMKIGVWSNKLSQMDMTELALWTIRPRLMAVPGVANVAIWGQRDRQYQVLVDPERLRAHGLTLADVERAAGDAAALDTGGFIDSPNQRLPVRHIASIAASADLADAVVAYRNGAALRLGDVTEVREGFPPPIGDAIINDVPGLLLIVEKQLDGNTLQITHDVEAALAKLRPGLQDLELDATIFRPATFIEMALHNLGWALIIGCVLVALTLIAFLQEWRTAVICISAIPLSLLGAVLLLTWFEIPMNTMVIAGLIIALGEVVDDAIIDVENIVRRLRANAEAESKRTAFRIVLDASLEVRGAVVYGTFTVMLVIAPVFFLDGLAGSFFRPLALAYLLGIFVSLVVAMTVTPALSILLLPGAVEGRQDSALVAWMKAPYQAILPLFAARPLFAGVAILVLVLAAGVGGKFLGEEFLPKFQEFDFLMHWVEKPGTSLEAMDRITIRVSQELRAVKGVRNFGSHIGRAEVADEVVGPNFTELWISLDPEVDYQSKVAEIQEIVDGYPGLYRDLLTYLRERIKEVLTGASATVVVRIYGDDLPTLRKQAEAVKAAIEGTEGVSDLKVEPQVLIPQIEVRLKPDAAGQFGVTAGDVRRAASTLIKGRKVGEVYRQQKIHQVVVWGVPEVRGDLDALRRCLVALPGGGQTPLGELADVRIVASPNIIQRENASRRIDVTCNVRGADLSTVARAVEAKVATVPFERGFHPEMLGEYAAQQASRRQLLLVGCGSILGIIGLLFLELGNYRLVGLVLLSFLFAFIGGVAGAWLGGGVLSLGSLVGFVTVVGIAVRNGIMIVTHYRHLEHEEGVPFGDELVIRGALERLVPMVMTSLTTLLALLPLLAAGNRPGHEIEYPMAWVILGGLTGATLMNLLLVPPLYRWCGKIE